MQDFQRDGPIVPPVLGQEHRGKAAPAELALDRVVLGERLCQPVVFLHLSGGYFTRSAAG